MVILQKTCIVCQVEKTLSEFHKNKSYSDGHDGKCKLCRKTLSKKYNIDNKERLLEKSRIYWHNTKSERSLRKKRYVEQNKERVYARNSKWKSNNKDKTAFYTSMYRAALTRATPKWLTKSHIEEIKTFYSKALNLTEKTGIKHHVDHIEPLNGLSFNGLHVPWNLQVLPHYENESKGNKILTNNA